mmetsp:Transcript_3172/g.11503  ORF Transcript_3172/g.11503 Transcript_3172/m.11503 type:complete len:469 (-) Transcript_3172:567-1973(-)
MVMMTKKACLVLLTLALAMCQVRSQMKPPLGGQAGFPPNGPVTVHVSSLLERLLAVDDQNYRFECILYVYFSWPDSTAWSRMKESTDAFRNGSKETCNRNCASHGEVGIPRTYGIPSFPGVPKGLEYAPEISCCDGVWLPSLTQLNVYELPEGRLQPYEIRISDSRSVAWWTAIHATYFTPMNFQRFPLDEQKLVVQFSFTNPFMVKEFVPSTTATRFLVRGEGDVVSGWAVDSIAVEPRNFSVRSEIAHWVDGYGERAVEGDTYPLILPDTANQTIVQYAVPDEGFYAVSFNVVIHIHRLWRYYLLNIIVPIFLLVVLSMVCYIMPATSLDARLALSITLFLSLTALQLVVNDQLPRSSYPTAITKIVLVYYISVAVAIPETVVVYFLANKANREQAPVVKGLEGIKQSTKGEGAEESPELQSNLSIALKTLQRKKIEKIPFMIDMFSLLAVAVTVVLSTVLILCGY